jgi:hypothetical protein
MLFHILSVATNEEKSHLSSEKRGRMISLGLVESRCVAFGMFILRCLTEAKAEMHSCTCYRIASVLAGQIPSILRKAIYMQ